MAAGDRIPVGIFLTSFDPGGTERQMVELVRRLPPDRFAVHVACFHRRGAWRPRVEERAASIAVFPIDGFVSVGTARQLRAFARWCRDRRLVVLQACDFYANVFGLTGAALARVPVRLGARRDVNPGRTRGRLALQRLSYRFAHVVVANSHAAAAAVVRDGVSPRRITIIPNGLDADRFSSLRSARPVRTIVTVANLRPEKDHRTLLAAARRLLPRHPQLRFQLVGDGPLRAELEREAERLGLSHAVEFLGHREDVPALLAAADLFVLPSRTEAFPNGVLEAMAAGLPAVACRVEGLIELVTDATGTLVPAADPAALAAAIERYVSDPSLAAGSGAAGRAHVVERFSFDAMVSAFERLYIGLSASAGQPSINVPCATQ
jgi:glycosyltransferase involved in cell wall biosynthesis